MKSLFKKLVVMLLTWEARRVLKRYTPSVVAVTGSVGKTSTKDAVHALMAEHASVRRSRKSYNSEIGVALTILGRPSARSNPLDWLQTLFDGLIMGLLRAPYPNWLVIEVGADRPGDIRSVVRWLPIDIAIITRLPEVPVHVEFFDSPEAVAEEKAALIAGLRPSGHLILNADDERVAGLARRVPASVRTLTFGFSEGATVQAEAPELLMEDGRVTGMRARIAVYGEQATVTLRGAIGAHAFVPVLAAIAVGITLDMPLMESVHAIERNYRPPPGRMHLLSGMRGSLIIDDSYNSSPAALEGALKAFAAIPSKGRKYAVLGDMMELGRFSVGEHRRAGALAGRVLMSRRRTPHMLITVGIRARDIAAAAVDGGHPESAILQFEEAEDAGAWLAQHVGSGDLVLIKGSQAMRLERAAELIMAEPGRAQELLVRQEPEWSKS